MCHSRNGTCQEKSPSITSYFVSHPTLPERFRQEEEELRANFGESATRGCEQPPSNFSLHSNSRLGVETRGLRLDNSHQARHRIPAKFLSRKIFQLVVTSVGCVDCFPCALSHHLVLELKFPPVLLIVLYFLARSWDHDGDGRQPPFEMKIKFEPFPPPRCS